MLDTTTDNSSAAIHIACHQCRRILQPADAVCPGCGHPSTQPLRRTAARPAGWTENRRLVVCLMVFAIGPLGFPVLWRSRAFSRFEKIFWTLLVTLEITGLVWLCVHFLGQAIEAWRRILQ